MGVRSKEGFVCVPDGSTHHDFSKDDPFFKIVLTEVSPDTALTDRSALYRLIGFQYFKDVRYQFVGGVWRLCCFECLGESLDCSYPFHYRLERL